MFAGYRQDPESALYQVRLRVYHPTLGGWLQRDPLGYYAGSSLYQYARSRSNGKVDPYGLADCNGATTTGTTFGEAKYNPFTGDSSNSIGSNSADIDDGDPKESFLSPTFTPRPPQSKCFYKRAKPAPQRTYGGAMVNPNVNTAIGLAGLVALISGFVDSEIVQQPDISRIARQIAKEKADEECRSFCAPKSCDYGSAKCNAANAHFFYMPPPPSKDMLYFEAVISSLENPNNGGPPTQVMRAYDTYTCHCYCACAPPTPGDGDTGCPNPAGGTYGYTIPTLSQIFGGK